VSPYAGNREEINRQNREWYHRTGYSKVKVAKNRERRIKLQMWFDDLKHRLGCSSCPENHPACIDFHHKDGEEKEHNISDMVRNGWEKKKILEEIAKCTPLCSNCHRKIHYTDKQNTEEDNIKIL
jgi:hypothetical protein